MTMDAKKSYDFIWLVEDPRHSRTQFSSKFKGIRRAESISSGLKYGRGETQRDLMFQFKSEGRKRHKSQLRDIVMTFIFPVVQGLNLGTLSYISSLLLFLFFKF